MLRVRIASAAAHPARLGSRAYAADFNEVKAIGGRRLDPDADQTGGRVLGHERNGNRDVASIIRSVASGQGGTLTTTPGCSLRLHERRGRLS